MLTAADDQVLAVPASSAVSVMMQAVIDHGHGLLNAPPRTNIALGDAQLTLTAGRLVGTATGFRLYSSAPEAPGEFTLVLQPGENGIGIVSGKALGRRRTGALGGVAASLCARSDADSIGLVGAGEQAFTQLWAIAAVRKLSSVRVYSRNADTADRFAQRAKEEIGIAVDTVRSARDAVREADIVVLATPATEPLIEVDWLSPGTHVHTLGPKGPAMGECPHQLVREAGVLVSDSPEQLLAMEGETRPWTGGREALSLGDIAVGNKSGRTSEDEITLYASVGLAGTEVLLARYILDNPEA